MGQRRVLVLGGTGAVGMAVARCFAEQGWDVVVTGRKPSPPPGAEGRVSTLALDLGVDHADEAAGRVVAAVGGAGPGAEPGAVLRAEPPASPVDLVVDAVGEFSDLPLTAPADQVQDLVWVNSFGRARVLIAAIDALRPGAAVVRIESSIGERPLTGAPVLSAAKAADTALSFGLARSARQRGIGFGVLVLAAARESLTEAEQAAFTARTGFPAPTCDDIARAVLDLGQLVQRSRLDVRTWFPDVVRLVDVVDDVGGV